MKKLSDESRVRGISVIQSFLRALMAQHHLSAKDQELILGLPVSAEVVEPGNFFAAREGAYYVSYGVAATVCCGRYGTEKITALYLAGDIAGLHLGQDERHRLQAVNRTRALFIPQSELHGAAQRPDICRAFWRHSNSELAKAAKWTANTAHAPALE